ncbi:MAG: hypothetical protein IJ882_06580 [Paludibacteraceae bacterium]|nr:hypothetical protein [Paludibacteraceae bacterium]
MTWAEFKKLSNTEQQGFIDKMGSSAPVNGSVLARYFGVDVHTVLNYLHAHALVANTRPCKQMRIADNIRSLATEVVRQNVSPDGVLRPCAELKTLYIQNGVLQYDPESTGYSLRLARDEEERVGRDVCQFTTENLEKVFAGRCGTGVYTHKKAVATIKQYTEFCREVGVNVSNDIQNFTPDTSQIIRDRMVASPLHLSIRLNKAFEPLSSDSVDCLYHCLMWLAFAGVPQDTLSGIRTKDIDLGALCVYVDGRKYQLYKEAIRAFQCAIQSTRFTMTNAWGEYTRERVSGDTLLRGFVNQHINVTSMLRNMVDKAQKRGVTISYSLIKQSGHFYRVYELERAGFEPNFADIIAERLERGTTSIKNSIIKRDYEAWKKAFG